MAYLKATPSGGMGATLFTLVREATSSVTPGWITESALAP